jgi:hypothetical protein
MKTQTKQPNVQAAIKDFRKTAARRRWFVGFIIEPAALVLQFLNQDMGSRISKRTSKSMVAKGLENSCKRLLCEDACIVAQKHGIDLTSNKRAASAFQAIVDREATLITASQMRSVARGLSEGSNKRVEISKAA